ncbi:peroxiredoxin [Chitinophaga sp. Cy-1792]|uniref:peroxiredoxin family protein n=1 Tax=Chitinophaga sp. Cy-1792 TaxID=2608339 RepID=UPI00142433CF|nr:TlpA disulfide reductase family protein [Chitinophaga sp. Cy-1792]NIG57517.1 TlpA family protein disulfide reductase [Chitinophaga sp. Cy-1792]
MKIIPFVLLLLLSATAFSQTNPPAKNTDPATSAWALRQAQFKAAEGKNYYELTNADSIFQAAGIARPHGACMLSFWFAGCAPCVAEFPELANLTKKYAAENFTLLSLTFENNPVIQQFQEKYNLSFIPKHISEAACNKLAFGGGYPKNIILDASGNIVLISMGGGIDPKGSAMHFAAEIIPAIDKALQQSQDIKATYK